MYNFDLLISPSVVKHLSGVDKNIDDEKIFPIIYRAQYGVLQEKLGTDLYNRILTDKTSSTLTGHYDILYKNYIVPCLVEWVLYYMTIDLSMPLTNKGMVRPTSDISDAGSIEGIRLAQQSRENSAEFWSERIVRYCQENCNNLPEYGQNNGLDKIKPGRTGYDIYFGGYNLGKNKGSKWH